MNEVKITVSTDGDVVLELDADDSIITVQLEPHQAFSIGRRLVEAANQALNTPPKATQ